VGPGAGLDTVVKRFMFLFMLRVVLCLMGFNFSMNELLYFVEWEVVTLNSTSIVITILLIECH
jgi:hypothetical protein